MGSRWPVLSLAVPSVSVTTGGCLLLGRFVARESDRRDETTRGQDDDVGADVRSAMRCQCVRRRPPSVTRTVTGLHKGSPSSPAITLSGHDRTPSQPGYASPTLGDPAARDPRLPWIGMR